ncbi:monothiol glutaredoxin-mitochondrial precursor [Grosmannia clavigera kw1407]|uniref:Monothiol glutaredoxin-5, mitochondrial n=1 Tax=Grosmannia clavigera (strain kw1407 / UAMH 11150) TaxID=655863 RepID=F0XE87_GROCL|nr:monothiol glutaredoxin-mitochondrial precursor [Grosmannia clavigera kw1407]EFX03742.1 monothiol glutaredoxin-mitochondrial precursor [Grosmannia clavigera kw1407]
MLSRTITRPFGRLGSRPSAACSSSVFAPTCLAASSPSFFSTSTVARLSSRRPSAPVASPASFALFQHSFPGTRRFLSDHTREAIDRAVKSAPVVLFMKGTPETPQCGFSRATIQILGLQGVDPAKFSAFNVLEDPELRAGIKEYSDWPTIPQLYVDGEFIGGCDILVSMHQGGDLAKLFEEKNVLIAASEEDALVEEKKE